MLQCFGDAQAYPEVCRAFSEVLERKSLVQIAGENRSSWVIMTYVRCWKYVPATVNGEPIDEEYAVAIHW
jgi:hypothetical protein